MRRSFQLGALAAFVVAAATAACNDQSTQPASRSNDDAPSPNATSIVTLQCQASVAAKSVSCTQDAPNANGTRNAVLIGRQNVFVKLTSSNVAYTAVDSAFKFDLTVQNLIPQALGTTNGTTADPKGVRVFFTSGPTVTSGTGSATVVADSIGTFTDVNQPFYKYAGLLGGDGILTQNEVSSAKQWVLKVPPTALTFSFAVLVSAEVKSPNGYIDINTPTQPFMLSGGNNQTLTGTVRDYLGQAVGGAITWSTSDITVVGIVDAAAGSIQSINPGFATITATSGARTGTVKISVCPNLAVGATYTAGPGKAAELCFAGFGAGAEYVYMPVDTSQATSNPSLSVTGSSMVAIVGPPSPNLIPSGSRLAVDKNGAAASMGFENPTILSDIDYMGNSPAIRNAMRDPSARIQKLAKPNPWLHYTIPVGWNPSVGDSISLNTNAACSGSPSVRKGFVKSKSQRLIVVADSANPATTFSTAQYDSIALEFDSIAWKVDSANFGAPTDQDGNGHVIAFFTRAVNELSPPASSSVVLGFFASKDIFPTSTCSNSNVGEMFYMLVPDPTGVVNGNMRSVAFVRGNTTGTIGHEFQHLINSWRRAYVTGAANFEEGFLNEGLSHIAEELMYYKMTGGLTPRSNIDFATLTATQQRVNAYNTFMSNNLGRLSPWLSRPDTAGAFKQNQNSLAVRGSIWAFLRYAVDRKGGPDAPFFNTLVNSNLEGIANIANALGAGNVPRDWLRDFEVAMYSDDAVAGISSTYTQPSWNLRSIYGGISSFPLLTRPLSNNVASNISYSQGGGTSYYRFGVSTGQFATLTTVGGSTKWQLIVMRTK